MTTYNLSTLDTKTVDSEPLIEYFETIASELTASDLHPNDYTPCELLLCFHFLTLDADKNYIKIIVDYFYLLKKYELYLIQNNNKINPFFHDLFIIHNIDFYDHLASCVLSQIDSISIHPDDLINCLDLPDNVFLDALFKYIVNA